MNGQKSKVEVEQGNCQNFGFKSGSISGNEYRIKIKIRVRIHVQKNDSLRNVDSINFIS
jgi:hypothetical protein